MRMGTAVHHRGGLASSRVATAEGPPPPLRLVLPCPGPPPPRGWLPPSAWMRAAPSARMGAACVHGRSHGATGRPRGCRAPPWGALLPRGWPPSGAASLLYPALPFSLLRGEIRMRVREGLIARCTRDVPMVLLLLCFFFSRSEIGFASPCRSPPHHRRHSQERGCCCVPSQAAASTLMVKPSSLVSLPFQAVAPSAAGPRQAGTRSSWHSI